MYTNKHSLIPAECYRYDPQQNKTPNWSHIKITISIQISYIKWLLNLICAT